MHATMPPDENMRAQSRPPFAENSRAPHHGSSSFSHHPRSQTPGDLRSDALVQSGNQNAGAIGHGLHRGWILVSRRSEWEMRRVPWAYSPDRCLRNWSASILSLFRPVESLFCRSAASKLTPVIDVIRSMRFGSYPNWIPLPGAVRSVIAMSGSPNPNCMSADLTRCAFSRTGRMRKSILERS